MTFLRPGPSWGPGLRELRERTRTLRGYWTTPDAEGYGRVLQDMEDLAVLGMQDPLVRSWATRVTRHVPGGAVGALISAVYRAVRSHVRYREDPVRPFVFAMIRTPAATLRERAGNCIDAATLAAAALAYLGVAWRFVSQGADADNRWHIYLEARDEAGRWLGVDPTLPARAARLGQRAPSPREWREGQMTLTVRAQRPARPRMGGLGLTDVLGWFGVETQESKRTELAEKQLAFDREEAARKKAAGIAGAVPGWAWPVAIGGGVIGIGVLALALRGGGKRR